MHKQMSLTFKNTDKDQDLFTWLKEQDCISAFIKSILRDVYIFNTTGKLPYTGPIAEMLARQVADNNSNMNLNNNSNINNNTIADAAELILKTIKELNVDFSTEPIDTQGTKPFNLDQVKVDFNAKTIEDSNLKAIEYQDATHNKTDNIKVDIDNPTGNQSHKSKATKLIIGSDSKFKSNRSR